MHYLNKEIFQNNQGEVKSSKDRESNWSFADNLSSIFKDADAVVILTEWELYKTINWDTVSKLMRRPAWIFDTRSIIQETKVVNSGLRFWKIGNGLG